MCYRDEYTQCKLCNNRRFHSAVLGEVDVPVVMQRMVPMVQTVQFSGWFFSRSIFWEPSMTHSCELSRARGVPESPGVLLPGDSAPGLCQLALVTCSAYTLVSSRTSVRNNNNKAVYPKRALSFCLCHLSKMDLASSPRGVLPSGGMSGCPSLWPWPRICTTPQEDRGWPGPGRGISKCTTRPRSGRIP